MAKQRKRVAQRNERDRTHGKCGRAPLMFDPIRPETNRDGIMMANKPLDGRNFRRMFVYADTTLTATRIIRDGKGNVVSREVTAFDATGMETTVDLKAYETRATKRPGWAFNAKTDARIRRNPNTVTGRGKP